LLESVQFAFGKDASRPALNQDAGLFHSQKQCPGKSAAGVRLRVNSSILDFPKDGSSREAPDNALYCGGERTKSHESLRF
jgi:hypothetical protein